ncbi:MAG: helix-turn-helix domain-containing protein [Bacteroidales bacterium]|nr:helix-turn-helix domain-containing protein [Bacteroidales bacterium]
MSDKEKQAFAQQISAEVALYQKEVLTSEEAARLLGISLSRLYKLTSARRIPHFKSPAGKLNYFRRNELEAWALSNRVSTVEELNDRAQAFTRR